MEKRWLGSIGFILLLVLLVFAVGYSSGNSPTGLGIFDRLTSRRLESSTANINVRAVCGNGIVEGNEVCDDGNSISGDGCHNCRLSFTVRRTEPGAYGTGEAPSGRGDGAGGVGDRDDLEEEQSKFVGGSGLGALTIDAARISSTDLRGLKALNPCETFTFRYGEYAEEDTGIALCNSIGYNSCVNVAFYETGDSFDTEVACGSSADDMISLVLMRYWDRQRPVTTMNIVTTCCNL